MEENATSANRCNINYCAQSSIGAGSAVADFASSIETPDLRNWFSSYVYQSPELSSSYCFEDSLSIEGKSTKDAGLYVEDSEGEEEHTRTDQASASSNSSSLFVKKIDVNGCCLQEFSDKFNQENKVLEYTDSLPSEPPDIRNWFSSYVYESPTLNTDEVGGSIPTMLDSVGVEYDDFIQKEKTLISTPKKASADFLANKSIQADTLVKCKRLAECVESETGTEQQENGLEDQSRGGSSCCADDFIDANPTEVHINPRLKDKGTKEMIEREEGGIAGSVSYHKNSSKVVGSPIKFTKRVSSNEAAESVDKASRIDSQRDPGWVMPKIKSKQGSSGRRISHFKSPEDSLSGDRTNTPKKKHRLGEKEISPEVDGGVVKTRKTLMEITNVCSSDAIAGKWRCPQKTKPSKGPPLKQLRLDKWVHRV